MSFYNKDKNPFPFYKLDGEVWSNTKPLWFRNNCKGCCYVHRVSSGTAYFQLQISSEVSGLASINVNVRKVLDNTVYSGIIITKTVLSDQDGSKYLSISAELGPSLVGDEFYISVETEFQKYYSEPFCVSQIKSNNIGIEWSSTSGKVGNLVYFNGFKNYINVDAVIVPLESNIEEETEEDGFGNETPTLQVLKQNYQLSFVVPNFIAQALSALPLHDKVSFINRALGESSTELVEGNKSISVKAVPELDNCFSYVEITYTDETIIKTACASEVYPLNTPPIADIAWNDTGTTENRTCDFNTSCSQVLKSTEFTIDPDGNLDTLEWERSDDAGATWTSLGFGTTKTITETVIGKYSYRMKATDTYGLFSYSNILRYKLFNGNVGQTPVLELVSSGLSPLCSGGGEGASNLFNITASASQVVRSIVKVTDYFGSGFVLQIKERISGNVLLTWNGGGIGSSTNLNFSLDANGEGKYVVELCMNPCLGTIYTKAAVLITLLDTDNITETDQTLLTEKNISC